jgi:quinol monooxygenase YgiN
VANIRVARPRRRGCRTAVLPSAEKLLADSSFPLLYNASVKQLASAEGVLGYSVLARPLSKQFWTLSTWKDEAALHAFVQYPPHVRIILLALGISGYFISQLQRVSVNQVSEDAQLGSPMQQLQIGIRTLGHR